MNDTQFSKLIDVLEKLAAGQNYTLTGAADWPIVVFLSGVIFSLIALAWWDLRSNIKGNRTEGDNKIKTVKEDSTKDRDILWQALKDCQDDCCPRKKTRE